MRLPRSQLPSVARIAACLVWLAPARASANSALMNAEVDRISDARRDWNTVFIGIQESQYIPPCKFFLSVKTRKGMAKLTWHLPWVQHAQMRRSLWIFISRMDAAVEKSRKRHHARL